MTSEYLTTPVSAIGTVTSAARRSGRTRGVPQTAPTKYAIQEQKAKEAKKKAIEVFEAAEREVRKAASRPKTDMSMRIQLGAMGSGVIKQSETH